MDAKRKKNWKPARLGAWCLLLALGLATLATGCASMTNPVVEGIPVSKVPPQLLGKSKWDFDRLPLRYLRQQPTDVYRVGPNDVLGIWIQGIYPPNEDTVPPIRFADASQPDLPPSFGFPTPVRDDGTIALPQIPPVKVKGLSIQEIDDLLHEEYYKRQILKFDNTDEKPDKEKPEAKDGPQSKDTKLSKEKRAQKERKIFVSLMQKRTMRIDVIREDAGPGGSSGGVGGYGSFGTALPNNSGSRGSGYVLRLPPGENDVLTALSRTGGMPSPDGVNEVIIERNPNPKDHELPPNLKSYIRIKLRVPKGTSIDLKPEDIMLYDGDVVYIYPRVNQFFYTGGLLPVGEYTLPTDHDYDVIKAITFIRGTLINGGFNGSNLSGSITGAGIGSFSPSLMTVLRKTEHGQVNIRVNLNEAFRNPKERILIVPDDILILQYTPWEAFTQYFFFQYHLLVNWRIFETSRATGTINGITF